MTRTRAPAARRSPAGAAARPETADPAGRARRWAAAIRPVPRRATRGFRLPGGGRVDHGEMRPEIERRRVRETRAAGPSALRAAPTSRAAALPRPRLDRQQPRSQVQARLRVAARAPRATAGSSPPAISTTSTARLRRPLAQPPGPRPPGELTARRTLGSEGRCSARDPAPPAPRRLPRRSTPRPAPAARRPEPQADVTAPPCNCSPTAVPTPTATATAEKTIADYPAKGVILDPSQTAEQTRTLLVRPDLDADDRVGLGAGGPRPGLLGRQARHHLGRHLDLRHGAGHQRDTGWDDSTHAGKYVVLDIGDFTFQQWLLLK